MRFVKRGWGLGFTECSDDLCKLKYQLPSVSCDPSFVGLPPLPPDLGSLHVKMHRLMFQGCFRLLPEIILHAVVGDCIQLQGKRNCLLGLQDILVKRIVDQPIVFFQTCHARGL